MLDLTGHKYGKLTVIREHSRGGKRMIRRWLCVCDCGNEVVAVQSVLRDKNRRAPHCGCNKKENKKLHPLYSTWAQMKQRCNLESNDSYPQYGARGIKVCERWNKSLHDFADDMGPKPTPSHTIDRIDNNGNYEPSNCRWATKKTQVRNRGLNRNNNSRISGVRWDKQKMKWEAVITLDYKRIYLGYHEDFFEAACARRSAEIRLDYHSTE